MDHEREPERLLLEGFGLDPTRDQSAIGGFRWGVRILVGAVEISIALHWCPTICFRKLKSRDR